jgi:uncharacterized glyoxalase superfamily protein PhnB
MNPPPNGWPRASSSLFYLQPRRAIDFLCAAFGFEVRIRIDGPQETVVHAELTYGGAVVMVSTDTSAPGVDKPDQQHLRSPRSVGGANTQALFLYVDDAAAHCARARATGAKIIREPVTTDYGPEHWADHGYEAEDPEGHRWHFAHRVRG